MTNDGRLKAGDENIVRNIRGREKEKVERYTDYELAEMWRAFSQSEDYPDEAKFLEWLSDIR